MINKHTLTERLSSLTESVEWKNAEKKILSAIDDFSMIESIKQGVVVGFSGGSDSVLLLIFLWNLKKSMEFNLEAYHINHSIRGDSADDDEIFSSIFADALGIKFISKKLNIPKIASEASIGIEEAARIERYKAFSDEIASGKDYNYIATAHNATDNLETLIFNLLRGSGVRGLSGIPPVRDNIIRPIIYLSKSEISGLLDAFEIPYVTDQTNFSTDYSRNYIRHEIIPKMNKLCHAPEEAAKRVSSNLRDCVEFFDKYASVFIAENEKDGIINASKLMALDKAPFAAVLSMFIKNYGDITIEKNHIDSIFALLKENKNFEYDIPSGAAFYRLNDSCYIDVRSKDISKFEFTKEISLGYGFTTIPELNIAILITNNEFEDCSSNIYNFSKKTSLPSAIMSNGLYVRTRREGDSYVYGGHTRKLKKLFNDKKLNDSEKSKLPIFCDSSGIIWVPGFGVRENLTKEKRDLWVSVYNIVDNA